MFGGMGGIPDFGSVKQGLMGTSPTASPSEFTSFGPGGGMDVMGTLKKNADFGSQYAGSPMAGFGMSAGSSQFTGGGSPFGM